MSLRAIEGAIKPLFDSARLRGVCEGQGEYSFSFVIVDKGEIVVVSETDGVAVVEQFCKCNGGTCLGNKIISVLKSHGFSVKD